MNTELVSGKATKKYLYFPQTKVSFGRQKRQGGLSADLLNWFAPKHYPSIFLDQRLRSSFLK